MPIWITHFEQNPNPNESLRHSYESVQVPFQPNRGQGLVIPLNFLNAISHTIKKGELPPGKETIKFIKHFSIRKINFRRLCLNMFNKNLWLSYKFRHYKWVVWCKVYFLYMYTCTFGVVIPIKEREIENQKSRFKKSEAREKKLNHWYIFLKKILIKV